jgi:hypothetical protein
MQIRIEDSGEVMAMYSERFDLSSFGHRKIERVTEILFDEERQCFYIEHCFTGQQIAFGFDAYSEAVSYEHEWFDQTVARGEDPRYTVPDDSQLDYSQA